MPIAGPHSSYAPVSLAATPLGLARDDLRAAMEPFVARHVAPDDPAWLAVVERKPRRAHARLRRRRWLGWLGSGRRDQESIEREYDASWARKELQPYACGTRPVAGAAWEYAGDAMFATMAAGARARLLVLMRAVGALRPQTVLEVGSGNGVNLLILACRFPEIRFSGVELTAGGVAVARSAQAEPSLPAVLQTFSPEPLRDPAAHRRVEFQRGSAEALPHPDASFDLVYSSLALEQMEALREKALAEMARVAARHTLMLEPFVESNDEGLRRAYRLARDHFAGAVHDLPRYGLQPIVVTDDLPGEVWLRPCLVISRKRGAGPSPAPGPAS
jgi:SAM-dependent methyltransferase